MMLLLFKYEFMNIEIKDDVVIVNSDIKIKANYCNFDDFTGECEIVIPCEIFKKWIIDNQYDEFHSTLPYDDVPLIEYLDKCSDQKSITISRNPDTMICFLEYVIGNNIACELQINVDHIFWVIHDLFHVFNHCSGDVITVSPEDELNAHHFAFEMMRKFDFDSYDDVLVY